MSMFCYQCEQTIKAPGARRLACAEGCYSRNTAGPAVIRRPGISMYAHRARQLGASDNDVDMNPGAGHGYQRRSTERLKECSTKPRLFEIRQGALRGRGGEAGRHRKARRSCRSNLKPLSWIGAQGATYR